MDRMNEKHTRSCITRDILRSAQAVGTPWSNREGQASLVDDEVGAVNLHLEGTSGIRVAAMMSRECK